MTNSKLMRPIHTYLHRNSLASLLALSFLMWGCGSLGLQAQNVTVGLKLDTIDIFIGQQVQLTATVRTKPGSRVEFPHFNMGDTLTDGLEVVGQTPVHTHAIEQGHRAEHETKYFITAFDSALFRIPPMKVWVDGKEYVSNTKLGLKVNMVPVDTTHVDQFAGPVEPFSAPFDWKWQLLAISLAGLPICLLMLMVAMRLGARKPLTRRKVILPQIPPLKEAAHAMGKLQELDDHAPADGGKQYYMLLTDTLRKYVSRRFECQAMEMTTDEILADMQEKVSPAHQDILADILRTADSVKFARYPSSALERSRHHKDLEAFLNATRDETLENPKPQVVYEVLNEGMQWKFRYALWLSILLLGAGGIGLIAYVLSRLAGIYGI